MSAEDERIATEKLLEVILGERSPHEEGPPGKNRAFDAPETEHGHIAGKTGEATSSSASVRMRPSRSGSQEETLWETKEVMKNPPSVGPLIRRKKPWRIFRAGREKAVLGLHMGLNSIKYVLQKQTSDGPVLQDFGIKILPAVSDGARILDEEIYAAAVRELVKDRGIQANRVVVAVSGPQVAIRRMLIPRVPPRELRDSIFWAVRKEIPFSPDNFLFDYHVIDESVSNDEKKLDTLVATAESSLAHRISRIMKKSGTRLDGIIPVSVAMWKLQRAVSIASGQPLAVLLDIGNRAATFAFFHSGAPVFTREVFAAGQSTAASIAGPAKPGDIAPGRKEVSPVAEEARDDDLPSQQKGHRVPGEVSASESLTGRSPVLKRLVNEINRSLDYWQSRYPDAPLEPIYISGGMVCMEGFERLMAEGLGLDVRRLNPFSCFRPGATLSDADALRDAHGMYAIAAGAALDDGLRINLLPKEERPRSYTPLDRLVMPAGAATIAAALLMAALFGYYTARIRKESRTVSEIQADQQKLATMVLAEEREMADQEKQLAFYRRVLSYMNHGASRAPAMMKELSLITPEEIILDRVVIDKKKNRASAGAASSPGGSGLFLEIKGGVFGNPGLQGSALARFLLALDQSPFFKFPRMMNQLVEQDNGTARLTFDLECQMEVEQR